MFRFDDFILTPNQIQDQVLDCFSGNKIPLSIAVVPYDENGDCVYEAETVKRIRDLYNAGLLEICLHGFNHHSYGTSLGEMCGYSDNEQFSRLSQGKQFLDSLLDLCVTTFIPPFNAYNDGTLKALDSLGFRAISSGLYPGQPTSSTNLQYYPETICNIDDVIGAMREAFEYNHNRDGIIVCMLHAYDITEDFTIEDLDTFLKDVTRLKGTHFYTYSQLIESGDPSDSKRIAANMELNLLMKLLKAKYIIQPTWKAIALRILNYLLYLLEIIILMIPSIVLRKEGHSKIISVVWLVSAIFAFLVVWLHLLGPLKAMLAVSILPLILFAGTVGVRLFSKK